MAGLGAGMGDGVGTFEVEEVKKDQTMPKSVTFNEVDTYFW